MNDIDFHSADAKECEYDALIVGASYSGLIAAAILANRGYRVAVIDALEQPGGRVGATRYRDCWISLGHRDGASGIGDIGQPNVIGRLAQRKAGIEIPVRKGAHGNNGCGCMTRTSTPRPK